MPLPEHPPSQLLDAMKQTLKELQDANIALEHRHLVAYHTWVHTALDRLRPVVSYPELERLLLTPRHMQMLATDQSVWTPQVRRMAVAELNDRRVVFERERDWLAREIDRWRKAPKNVVVADTNIYIEHPVEWDQIAWSSALGDPVGDVLLVVPIAVIDELDGLKRNPRTRNRARSALKKLSETLGDRPEHDNIVRASEPDRGNLSVTALFDPPGHVRLPIADDEIVDRARFVTLFVGHPVAFATLELSGADFRGRAAELRLVRLEEANGGG